MSLKGPEGAVECESVSWQWAKCLRLNTGLRHLDLSFNHLTTISLIVLDDGLLENHNITGLHVSQDKVDCYADSLGFIKFGSEEEGPYDIHLYA